MRRRITPAAEGSSASVARMSRLFKCPYCNYSSNRKDNLTRHVNVHSPLNRYCPKCDLQFASYKKYQVHKEQYCSTRHVPESIDSSSSPTSMQQLRKLLQQRFPQQQLPQQQFPPEQLPQQQLPLQQL
ncbi:hypothetical protein CDAR_399401 [Caerostris darwini]|uniref:C2H2-type domain-containing protein n=1 Tax=Caerostris darwini TaxID=1538125 RepID=A0AAV4SUK5_9ARAC|nr:hypothetical protein CDAR_399401 [Caerostris darwini]